MNPNDGGIRASGISRSFGAVQAITHIDFEAPPGEVTALIGPNGSGKTTLLLILASLLAPDTGTVSVCGADPAADAAAVRGRIGWMPDTLGIWESLSAREILTMMGRLYGLATPAAKTRADELLHAVRLDELANQPARVLSRGQQQRLSLARALLHEPQVLLLDEPASGLDPGSRVELRRTLRRLAGEGKTIVVSSHVLSELDEIADGAVFIDRGRSVKTQTIAEAALAGRRYSIQSPDLPLLISALEARGVGHLVPDGQRRAEVTVVLDSEAAAAALLRSLILADVVITAFAPAAGALEETYLSLNTEQR